MHVTVDTAKAQLARLIEAALAGEEVIIEPESGRMVRLVPVAQGGFRLGVLAGAVPSASAPDFLAPLGEAELADWEGR